LDSRAILGLYFNKVVKFAAVENACPHVHNLSIFPSFFNPELPLGWFHKRLFFTQREKKTMVLPAKKIRNLFLKQAQFPITQNHSLKKK